MIPTSSGSRGCVLQPWGCQPASTSTGCFHGLIFHMVTVVLLLATDLFPFLFSSCLASPPPTENVEVGKENKAWGCAATQAHAVPSPGWHTIWHAKIQLGVTCLIAVRLQMVLGCTHRQASFSSSLQHVEGLWWSSSAQGGCNERAVPAQRAVLQPRIGELRCFGRRLWQNWKSRALGEGQGEGVCLAAARGPGSGAGQFFRASMELCGRTGMAECHA